MSIQYESGDSPPSDKIVDQGKDKNGDTYIAIHVEKGHIQFTEIIGPDKEVLIQQKASGNHTKQQANRNTVKYPRYPQGGPYAKDFWYGIDSVLPVKIHILQSIENIKSRHPEYDGKRKD